MKKFFAALLGVALGFTLFFGCAPKKEETEKKLSEVKTMQDLFTLTNEENNGYSFDEENVVYVFELDKTHYRAIAAMDRSVYAEIDALDVFDDDYHDRVKMLLRPLPVENIENLSEQILSKEQLSALVGKTGRELFMMGFDTGYQYVVDEMLFHLTYGAFEYAFTFAGSFAGISELDYDHFDVKRELLPLTVTSAAFYGVSPNAMMLEEVTAPKEVDVTKLKTIGDLISTEGITEYQYGLKEGKYLTVFEANFTIYLATATISKEDALLFGALDFGSDEFDEERIALTSSLPIEKIENLSEQIPTREELKDWVGKTGEELLQSGFQILYASDSYVFMEKLPFNYFVAFEKEIDSGIPVEEEIKNLKVTSVVYAEIGYLVED